MPRRLSFLLALLVLARALAAADEAKIQRFAPTSQTFACDVPAGWSAFEEQDSGGLVVHMLGPDNPAGDYRTGIDIRWVERTSAGLQAWKKAIDSMRRSDKTVERSASSVRLMRVSGILMRLFEVTEKRRLPPDRLPSTEDELHHYVAVIPSGESFFLVKLSSTRDIYLDYRDLFVNFLKTFKPLGYK